VPFPRVQVLLKSTGKEANDVRKEVPRTRHPFVCWFSFLIKLFVQSSWPSLFGQTAAKTYPNVPQEDTVKHIVDHGVCLEKKHRDAGMQVQYNLIDPW
jgi:hypothetical protein